MQPRLLLITLASVLIYMTLWFLMARKRRRMDLVDSAWGSGFVLVAWLAVLQQPAVRTFAAAILVTIWSVRLTLHLARRYSSRPDDDPRYVEMAKKWQNVWLRAYFSIFLLQGVLVWLIALPLVANTGAALRDSSGVLIAGVCLWLVGFVIERRADKELARFVADKNNKGKVLDTGLWHYSRHPNYFGELLQWWSIGLIACRTSFGWWGLAGPLVLSILIIFVSGIPPIEKRRKDNKAYQAYKRRTSPLIPWPPKPAS